MHFEASKAKFQEIREEKKKNNFLLHSSNYK